jgi:SAM-dependent methyltransferase
LAQTEDFAAPKTLFTADYAYFSSFSEAWLRHARAYVSAVSDRFRLSSDSLVIEVAANDGYLLQYLQQIGIPCLGVEPTRSTAAAARHKGIPIVEEFFGFELAKRLVAEGRRADLTIANNVLAHVPDINDFVSAFALLLKPNGVASFEFQHILELIRHSQFDTVYHEHFTYLSMLAVEKVFTQNGLKLFDVETLPTHGGSLRVFAQRMDTGKREISPAVASMRLAEATAGLHTDGAYEKLQPRAEAIRDALVMFLIHAKARGKRVAAYGAAAKGNTLLNFAGIRPDLVRYVVDRNPAKIGRFMPASHIAIVDEEYLCRNKPDYILLLPWNLRDEISSQLDYVRGWGTQLVTAIPKLTVF